MKFTPAITLLLTSLVALSSALPTESSTSGSDTAEQVAGPVNNLKEKRQCGWSCNVYSDTSCPGLCRGCGFHGGYCKSTSGGAAGRCNCS